MVGHNIFYRGGRWRLVHVAGDIMLRSPHRMEENETDNNGQIIVTYQ